MGIWFRALFSGLVGFFSSWVANKTIFATSTVVGFLALTGAFVLAIKTLASSLSGVVPSWAVGLGYLIPDNAALCFSVLVSARLARWVYDYHKEVLKTAASV